jgi:diguanylate cyclase (GGDEF)-like protein
MSDMATSRRRKRPARPVLLLLVFGAFLVIVGATASGQALLVTADASTTILNSSVSADAAAVRSFVGLNLRPSDLEPGGLTSERGDILNEGLRLMTASGGILHALVITPAGTVIASDTPEEVGRQVPITTGLSATVQGHQADAAIVAPQDAGALGPLATTAVLREYLPLAQGEQVMAVVGVWRDAVPILAQLDEARIHTVVITIACALIGALLLFFIFRSAQQRITRQARELVEAMRRDPLTGALNHGALVEALAVALDRARRHGGAVGVALLDLDNFQLLNDTYSHEAGDRALGEVAELLGDHAPHGATWGRYGPDEFLLVSEPAGAAQIEPAVERLRTALADRSLQFEASERLPVTFSAGIAAFPDNGESVTTLLSVAAITLDEAKGSGGDAVRVAEASPAGPAFARSFDILQGLVIAVDTKDRYTRRHSEDVARYADFLASLLDLDPELRRALHTAGLLHDIGKIGIPDVILRKPARLTEEEYAIVKQHVALGDMIVRDLPGIEVIRAGIRHHHERWDGLGYLDRLAGEEIPLAARVLAVGDAFSAMTTTRPYRKGLSVTEALSRLEDAAGTQLDAHLVTAFVKGIETAPAPPLPGDPSTSTSLWVPPHGLTAEPAPSQVA